MESVPSPAAQLMVTVIPIVGIVVAGVMVFFFLLWSHRQRMAQIERGMKPPPVIDLKRFSLLFGLLATAVGLVLTLVAVLAERGGYGLLGGLIPISVGVSFLVYYHIVTNERGQ
ncbi:MAG: hypothetical protein GVY23_02105 [Spirochaetes bacterium]|jgi:hypothetical protein|nr:hypothetical protein [Spirochaetota bacterium]